MAKFILDVRAADLVALETIAPKKDVRFYLNGIHFRGKYSNLIMEASNGHVAAFVRGCELNAENTDLLDHDFILPVGVFKASKTEIKKSPFAAVAYDSETRMITITHAGRSVSVQAIDGRYPDVNRAAMIDVCTPDNLSATVQLDPDYIKLVSDAVKAMQVARGTSAAIIPMVNRYRLNAASNGRALVMYDVIDPACFGFIMGLKFNNDPVDLGSRAKKLLDLNY